MSNVLPKEKLQSGWRAFRLRFVLVGALVLAGLAALTVAALLPAYVALHADASGRASEDGLNENSEAQAARDELIHAQILLSRIMPLITSTSSPTAVIRSAAALAPPGIALDDISITSGVHGIMTLKGAASNRDAINAYKDALSKNGAFGSVSIPVEALVRAAQGKFTITLSGIF